MKKVVLASSHILRCLYIMRHTAYGCKQPFVAFYGTADCSPGSEGSKDTTFEPHSILHLYSSATWLSNFFMSGLASNMRYAFSSTFRIKCHAPLDVRFVECRRWCSGVALRRENKRGNDSQVIKTLRIAPRTNFSTFKPARYRPHRFRR